VASCGVASGDLGDAENLDFPSKIGGGLSKTPDQFLRARQGQMRENLWVTGRETPCLARIGRLPFWSAQIAKLASIDSQNSIGERPSR